MSTQRLQEVRFAQRVLVEAIPKAFRRIIKPGCGCKDTNAYWQGHNCYQDNLSLRHTEVSCTVHLLCLVSQISSLPVGTSHHRVLSNR